MKASSLSQPVTQPFFIDVAHGLAGAHCDAEHVVVVEAHGPGEGGDVAVVGHDQRHVAYLLRGADVDVLDLLVELVLRHLEEEGGDHGAVLDIDAR